MGQRETRGHGATFKEIGEELGISDKRVHQLYARAIKKLRRIIAAEPEFRAMVQDILGRDVDFSSPEE